MVLKRDGSVYTWGSNMSEELGLNQNTDFEDTPKQVPGLNDIRYISAGSEYSMVLNKQNEILVCGKNALGELGNNTYTNVNTFERLDTIDTVIDISCGNTYTSIVKADGTVWGTGDYAHGNINLNSKTKSDVPIQVGNDSTGLKEVEITIKIGETKNILDDCVFAFNLIYLDKDAFNNLEFDTLEPSIATINANGEVTAKRVGTTRVTMRSTLNYKLYSVLVKVIEEDSIVAPKVEAGENFALITKDDGTIWSFGYNGDGRAVIGNYLTKDIPTKANINGFKEVSVGEKFVIALAQDGTVWTCGNNEQGQLRKRK